METNGRTYYTPFCYFVCYTYSFFMFARSFVIFFLTTHPFDLSNCHDHCFPQSLRVTNYTVTVFHYYRYITLRHYIFINSSRSLATIQQYHVKLVNLCLNRREIARCNSSGFKGKKKEHMRKEHYVKQACKSGRKWSSYVSRSFAFSTQPTSF